MKKKASTRQIMAIIGIVLMLSMYLMSLIFAIINNGVAHTMFKISLVCTVLIPIIIYILNMFYKLSHRNDDNESSEGK